MRACAGGRRSAARGAGAAARAPLLAQVVRPRAPNRRASEGPSRAVPATPPGPCAGPSFPAQSAPKPAGAPQSGRDTAAPERVARRGWRAVALARWSNLGRPLAIAMWDFSMVGAPLARSGPRGLGRHPGRTRGARVRRRAHRPVSASARAGAGPRVDAAAVLEPAGLGQSGPDPGATRPGQDRRRPGAHGRAARYLHPQGSGQPRAGRRRRGRGRPVRQLRLRRFRVHIRPLPDPSR